MTNRPYHVYDPALVEHLAAVLQAVLPPRLQRTGLALRKRCIWWWSA